VVEDDVRQSLQADDFVLEQISAEFTTCFGRFRVSARQALTRREVADRLHKIEHALEVAVLQRPMSEVNVNQADATERLIRAVTEVENAVMVIGSLILVKTTGADGERQLFAKTLSVPEMRSFEANQHLMKSPREALEHLHLLAAAADDDTALEQ